jgi:hypothetical protein
VNSTNENADPDAQTLAQGAQGGDERAYVTRSARRRNQANTLHDQMRTPNTICGHYSSKVELHDSARP